MGRRSLNTRKQKDNAKSGLEVAGEAMNLLRVAPFHVTVCYFIGAVPFVLGFLFFASDMSRSAYAYSRCHAASFGIAILFIWMKCWHSVFSRGLLAGISRVDPPKWSIKRILKMVCTQTLVQPWGLIIIPVSLILMLPFYCSYAFYQNVVVLGHGGSRSIKEVVDSAWKQSLLWPKQNHMLIWLLNPWVLGLGIAIVFGTFRFMMSLTPEMLEYTGIIFVFLIMYMMFFVMLPLSPFGCVVASNVAAALIMIPYLLKVLLGIETAFSLGGYSTIFNTTFLMTVFCISYMFLDIVSKAAYTLRCFYGDSLRTGADLLVELGDEAL